MILSELYSDLNSIQRIVNQVGLSEKVNTNGDPISVWVEILSESKKHNRLLDIYKITAEEYPIKQNEIFSLISSYSKKTPAINHIVSEDPSKSITELEQKFHKFEVHITSVFNILSTKFDNLSKKVDEITRSLNDSHSIKAQMIQYITAIMVMLLIMYEVFISVLR